MPLYIYNYFASEPIHPSLTNCKFFQAGKTKVTDFSIKTFFFRNKIYTCTMHTLYNNKTVVIHLFIPGYPPKPQKIHSKGLPYSHILCKKISTILFGKFPPDRTTEVVNFTRHNCNRLGAANVMEIIDFHKIKTVLWVPARISK